jgi:hypothetical protein
MATTRFCSELVSEGLCLSRGWGTLRPCGGRLRISLTRDRRGSITLGPAPEFLVVERALIGISEHVARSVDVRHALSVGL